MSKRHILHSEKQYLGQYFTSKSEEILRGWESVVAGKDVIDPFAGGGDLLQWATNNKARHTSGYDIDTENTSFPYNDSLLSPPDFSSKFLLSNPPYLAANKCRDGDKRPYKTWGQSDYYKCHLASLYPTCQEGILILPSNFLSESNRKAREMFFYNYEIVEAKYWQIPIFEDALTGITAFLFQRKPAPNHNKTTFRLSILPINKNIEMSLEREYGYLHGKDFFDYVKGNDYNFTKATTNTTLANSRIVVGCLDKGKYPLGFHINNGTPLITRPSQITTYQINTPNPLSPHDQEKLVFEANKTLRYYREQYDSMFLSNYLGARQKIMSWKIAKSILCKELEKI